MAKNLLDAMNNKIYISSRSEFYFFTIFDKLGKSNTMQGIYCYYCYTSSILPKNGIYNYSKSVLFVVFYIGYYKKYNFRIIIYGYYVDCYGSTSSPKLLTILTTGTNQTRCRAYSPTIAILSLFVLILPYTIILKVYLLQFSIQKITKGTLLE